MAENPKVRRIVQIKIRTAMADAAAQLLAMVRTAMPAYEAFAQARIRVLRNVDDPSQFVQVITYETAEALEMNRKQVASDPMIRQSLDAWRMMMMGTVEIDVYEDLTEAS